MSLKRIFQITISSDYRLRCSTIDSNGNETVVKLQNEKETYSPCISFEGNNCFICEEKETSLNFMKEWVEESTHFKQYTIIYQEKEYHQHRLLQQLQYKLQQSRRQR